jgi:hypothetical protein
MEAEDGWRIPPPLPLSRTIGGEGKQRRPIGASIQPPLPPFPASLYSLHISLLWASFYSTVQAYTRGLQFYTFFGISTGIFFFNYLLALIGGPTFFFRFFFLYRLRYYNEKKTVPNG